MDPADQGISVGDTNPKDKFRHGVKYTHRLAQEWWNEWINTCLHPLQARQKWRSVQRDFQMGDLVLLVDPSTPAIGRYPYALVTDVKKCPDGRVRSATVRLADGRIRERDVHKLVLIEPVQDGRINQNQNVDNLLKKNYETTVNCILDANTTGDDDADEIEECNYLENGKAENRFNKKHLYLEDYEITEQCDDD